MRKVFCFIIFLQINFFAFSQNDTVAIAPVIINHKISSHDVFSTEIDSNFLQQNKDLQLSDLLKQNQSVFIKSFGNFGSSTASFRGTSATHTQVLWNGVSLNSPMLGQTDFSIIPAFFSDKISTSPGISSLENASGALGGSIVLNSFPDYSKKMSIELNQAFASFGNYTSDLNFNFSKNKIKFNTRVQYSSGKNDYTYLNTAIPGRDYVQLKNADFNQYSILQNIYLKLNKNNYFAIFLWYTNTNRNIPPIMSFEGLERIENQVDKKLISGIKYSVVYKKIKVKNTIAFSKNRLNYFLGDSVFSLPSNDFIIKNNSFSSENSVFNNFSGEISINDKLKISTKINLEYNSVNTYDSATYVQTGYSVSRFFHVYKAIFVYQMKKDNYLSAIISENMINKKIYSPVYVLSYKYRLNQQKGVYLGFNIGKNIHIPTLNDLFWQPGGNKDLLPENGFSSDFSFGYKLSNNYIDFDFKNTFFVSSINNWIIWKPTEFQYWTAQNIKKVFSRGDEFFISFTKKGKITLKTILNYSFTLSTNQESYYADDMSLGKQLIYTPVNIGNFFTILNYKKISFSSNINYTGKRYTSTSNYGFYSLSSYTLLDLYFSKYFLIGNTKSKLTLKIYNVLNNQYQAILFRPMPGINLRFNFSIEF